MDKFEYELKVEQIEKLIGREDYSTAKKIADTMEWKREKDPKLLARVAELYAQAGDIEKALKIYNFAYNASSRGLLILERMTELALIFGQLDLAEELCEEYRSAGAYDADYYLFKFQIAESRGEDLDKRISWLEKYCGKELDEEALYRLAWMYDRAEREKDCVRICDYIIDFFCFGESVERAIALKQKHAPLTKYQERRLTDAAKYEQNYQRYMKNADEEDRRTRREKRQEEQIREDALMEKQENALGKQVSEIVKQNELEKQEVHLDALVAEEELMARLSFPTATSEVVDEQPYAPAEHLTAGETIEVPGNEAVEEETGGLAAEEVKALAEEAEIKETGEANEEPEAETVSETLEEAETGDAGEANEEPEAETVSERLEEAETGDAGEANEEPEAETVSEMSEEAETAEEGDVIGALEESGEMSDEADIEEAEDIIRVLEGAASEISGEADKETAEAVIEALEPEMVEEAAQKEKDALAEDSALEQLLLQNINENLQAQLSATDDIAVDDASDSAESSILEVLLEEIEAADISSETEEKVQVQEEADAAAAESTDEAAKAAEAEEAAEVSAETENSPISTYAQETETEPELEPHTRRKTLKRTSELSALDLVVPEGSFKVACSDTELGVKYALELVRMVPEEERCEHVAKISARQVNKAKFSGIEQQLDRDILLITNAGQLTNGALESIYTWMKKSMDNRVVLVDNQEQLDSLEKRKPKLMKRFAGAYAYEKKETQEWLELIDSYVDENDCVLADDAYQLFEDYLRDKEEKGDVVLGVNLKDAVQDALHQATKFSFSNMLSSILDTKYDEDGLLVLRDRHFL